MGSDIGRGMISTDHICRFLTSSSRNQMNTLQYVATRYNM